MMLPSIFGEGLLDNMMDFSFSDDFFGRNNPLYGKQARNLMKTDIKEKDGTYEMSVDLPGFKKEEIQLRLENGYLTIGVSKNLNKDEQDKDGNYIRRERYYGSNSRSFYVGRGVQQDDIKAKYEDGILKLEIAKKEDKAPEQKCIAIEG